MKLERQPAATTVAAAPIAPRPFVVDRTVKSLRDTVTLHLSPGDAGGPIAFRPGQFTMLYAFGVGEVPISISGDPAAPEPLVHTVRAVGSVTRAIFALKRGGVLGVRGPFGSAWPEAEIEGRDVVIVAGGIGLAPLRPAILSILANRGRFGRFVILYGARTPREILFRSELGRWGGRLDTAVEVTVDRAAGDWFGSVGVVTRLIARAGFDPDATAALVCGPEVMMRYAVQALQDRGVAAERIWVSMERNMRCAVGFCGHCQWGGSFVCRDGPVFRFDRIAALFDLREY